MTSILSITTVVLALVGFCVFKWWQAKLTIEQVLKTNVSLEHTVKQQGVEIQTKNAEIKYAQIQRKNSETVKRSNALGVDQQLQQHGWFRAEDNHNGVQCVQPHLSKSCGHTRDEASDTHTQSDSSGDM